MINYKKGSKKENIIKEERMAVSAYTSSQSKIKTEIEAYIKELEEISFEDKSFKILLLNDFNNSVGQIDNNIQDLQSLTDILDILETQEEFASADILIYNKLLTKVENNMFLVTNIIEKSLNRFDNVKFSSDDDSAKFIKKVQKALLNILSPKEKKADSKLKKTSKEKIIKQVADYSSSDFVCFFPKTENENLVISTVQNSYKISFVENLADISIEFENFNMSLKTAGVQISNPDMNNVLLVSYEDSKYILLTNNQMEIPPFLKICKIAKKDDFIEVEIYADKLNLYVEDNIISFDENETEPISIPHTHSIDEINDILHEFENKSTSTNAKAADEKDVIDKDADSKKSIEEKVEDNKNDLEDEPKEIKDNDTLRILDSNKTVILPYKVSDLEAKMKKNKKYKTLEDVINSEYTLPLEIFKNPIRSRFREAFQLIKRKEHGSLKEAISLGFELMFESDLNPTIIAACRNLDELDIYLDCLDDNELDKFSCFKIDYQVPPEKKKKK